MATEGLRGQLPAVQCRNLRAGEELTERNQLRDRHLRLRRRLRRRVAAVEKLLRTDSRAIQSLEPSAWSIGPGRTHATRSDPVNGT